MDLKQSFPTFGKLRFSIVQLLLLTTGMAFFFAVLFSENEWLLATYTTLLTGILLHQCVTAICARGERQFFALGFVGCIPVYYMCVYTYAISLPYLVSVKIYNLLEGLSSDLPSEQHFIGVISAFGILLSSYGFGCLGRHLYHQNQREEPASENPN